MSKVPMPAPVASLWLKKDGVAVNAFNYPPGDKKFWDKDGPWEAEGYARQPLFTDEQMEAYAAAKVREAADIAMMAPITAGVETSDDAKAACFHAHSRILSLLPSTPA